MQMRETVALTVSIELSRKYLVRQELLHWDSLIHVGQLAEER